MSLIPEKFRDKSYKGAEDWLSNDFLNKHAMTEAVVGKRATGPDEPAVKSVPATINIDALFDLAKANGADAEHLRPGAGNHGAAGRIKMTIGNMLRSRAKKRGGLFDASGEWNPAPDEFMVDKLGNAIEPVEDRDGKAIKPAKVEPVASKPEPEIEKPAPAPAAKSAPAAKKPNKKAA